MTRECATYVERMRRDGVPDYHPTKYAEALAKVVVAHGLELLE